MAINKVIFGSDFRPKIKEKLEWRQAYATNSDPLAPIGTTTDYETQFGGKADLSSRTPFARMWTAVQLFYMEKDVSPEEKNETTSDTEGGDKVKLDIKYNVGLNDETHKSSGLDTSVQEVDTPIIETVQEKIDKEIELEKTIYVVGNHVYNSLTNNKGINQPIIAGEDNVNKYVAGTETSTFFTKELSNNDFMKPPAGITSISSATEGGFGPIKRTTVNFTVNNFSDYENIYSRFFLKPGAQVFIDFGWNTADLYDPNELMRDDRIESYSERGSTVDEILYGEDGFIETSNGDLETLIGNVVSFDSKIKENGTFECSVEILSKNNALLDYAHQTKSNSKPKFTTAINTYLINLVAEKLGEEFLKPNWLSSHEQLEEYRKYANSFGKKVFGGTNELAKIPEDQLKLGIYWQALQGDTISNNNNLYISWGFFEDELLNKEFSFKTGDSVKGIFSELDIEFDSSNSFVKYDLNLKKRQTSKLNDVVGKTKLKFIYPEIWDNTYNTQKKKIPDYPDNVDEYNELLNLSGYELKEEFSIEKSPLTDDEIVESIIQWEFKTYGYQTQDPSRTPYKDQMSDDVELHEYWTEDKTTFEFICYKSFGRFKKDETYIGGPNGYVEIKKIKGQEGISNYSLDLALNRIPFREIFINTNIIREAFKGKDTVNEAMKYILDELNKDSYGVFNLQLYDPTGHGSTFEVVDSNFSGVHIQIDDSFEEYFKFKPNSKNSIVKSMDVSFKMPENGAQDIIAIQNSSNYIPLFPQNSEIDMNNSLRMIDNVIPVSDDQKSFISMKYIPQQTDGNLIKKRLDTTIPSLIDFIEKSPIDGGYEDATKKLDNYSKQLRDRLDSVKSDEDLSKLRKNMNDNEIKPFSDDNPPPEKDLNETDLYPNAYFAKDLEDYYGKLAKKDFVSFDLPSDLNVDASLSIYGTAGIIPGNLFRIDYLPKKYRDNVFFQVTGVTHEIGTSTWTTTLNSIMRIAPESKKRNKWMVSQPSSIFISSNWVNNQISNVAPVIMSVMSGFQIYETDYSVKIKGGSADLWQEQIYKPLLVLSCKSIRGRETGYWEEKFGRGDKVTISWKLRNKDLTYFEETEWWVDIKPDKDYYIVIGEYSTSNKSAMEVMVVDKEKANNLNKGDMKQILDTLYTGTEDQIYAITATKKSSF